MVSPSPLIGHYLLIRFTVPRHGHTVHPRTWWKGFFKCTKLSKYKQVRDGGMWCMLWWGAQGAIDIWWTWNVHLMWQISFGWAVVVCEAFEYHRPLFSNSILEEKYLWKSIFNRRIIGILNYKSRNQTHIRSIQYWNGVEQVNKIRPRAAIYMGHTYASIFGFSAEKQNIITTSYVINYQKSFCLHYKPGIISISNWYLHLRVIFMISVHGKENTTMLINISLPCFLHRR